MEHPSAELINLHILDAKVPDTVDNLEPDVVVMSFVCGNQLWVVFEIQR